jgi:uncharacterized membrane protein YbaN (DUF454 family)
MSGMGLTVLLLGVVGLVLSTVTVGIVFVVRHFMRRDDN